MRSQRVLAASLALSMLPFSAARAEKPFEGYTTQPVPATSSSYVGPTDGNTYTYGGGNDLELTTITAGGGTIYYPVQIANQVLISREDNAQVSGERCNIFVERGSSNFEADASFPADGSGNCSLENLWGGLIINRGLLDPLSNHPPSSAERPNNIERVDFVYTSGITAPSSSALLDEAGHIVMEKNGNNPVKTAAILAVDGAGNPTQFGAPVTIDVADYGEPNPGLQWNFLADNSITGPVENPEHFDDKSEPIGGTLVTLQDFGIGVNQTYYGFAVFATDVPDNADLTNTASFPDNTPDGSGNTGGADIHGGMGGYWASFTTVSGTVFEDVNYGGGAGRSLADASGVGRPNVGVELYDSTGDFVAATVTDASGQYKFEPSLTRGAAYSVRIVNNTVTSSRALNGGFTTADTVAVQTYRYDPDAATPAVTTEVGGASPTLADSDANATDANLSTLTTSALTPQSVTTFVVNGATSGVDFGFNFDTIVNTNSEGQGSLRQFINNSNALSNAGLDQADTQFAIPAGLETSIFMIPDPSSDPRVTAAQVNYISGVDGGTGNAFVIQPTTGLPSLLDDLTAIDGRLQTAFTGDTNTPINEVTTGPEVIVDYTLINTAANGLSIRGAQGVLIDSIGVGRTTGDPVTATGHAIETFNATRIAVSDPIVIRNSTTFESGLSGIRTQGIDASGIPYAVEILDNITRDNSQNSSIHDGIDFQEVEGALASGNQSIGHRGFGVDLVENVTNVVIENNFIQGNGQGNNQAAGIGIRTTNSNVLVIGNTITGSKNDGITVNQTSTGATFLQNSIYSNGSSSTNITHLGIDLRKNNSSTSRGDGVTGNDANDGDAGGNELLNFPVATGISSQATGSTINFDLDVPVGNYRVEFYSNTVQDVSGHGEGEQYLGFIDIAHGGTGSESFSHTVSAPVGSFISMTTTEIVDQGLIGTDHLAAFGSTSEFSGVVEVPAVSSNPDMVLVKRITAINRGLTNEQLFDNSYIDVGTNNDGDNAPEWPANYLSGVVDGISVQPGDEIEYTIYFLSNGNATATDFRLCDRIPDYLSFVDDAFNPDAGILFGLASGNSNLTNTEDADKGAYIASNGDSLTHCRQDLTGGTQTQDNGFIVINVGDVPAASSNPTGAYGFVRFRAQVQ